MLRKLVKTLCSVALVGSMTTFSMPVFSVNEAMLDLLKILKDKGSISAQEYDLLRNAALADGEKVEGKTNELSAKLDEKTKSIPSVSLKGKFKIASQDGAHSFQPIGRIFWDTVWADDDGIGNDTVNGGSELRRARLGFSAQFYKYWKAKLEYDFAGSDADLKDAYISYNNSHGSNKYNIKIGQHHVPFGFHTKSSSKYMSFLRRPLFADGPLSPARQYGVAFQLHEKNFRWNINAGYFLNEPEDGEANVPNAGEDAKTFGFRVTGVPFIRDKSHMLHVGASYMSIDPSGDRLRVRQRGLTHLDNDRIFNADFGSNADGVDAFDIEVLGIMGPFYALGEYVHWDVDDPDGDADLSAWSIEGGWFLTGESKKYKGASLSSISPKSEFGKGGWGAWELALRYENMDLNDGAYIGGDGDSLTAGINWYPIKNVRFMANYTALLDFDRTGNVADGTEPSSFSLRGQVYW